MKPVLQHGTVIVHERDGTETRYLKAAIQRRADGVIMLCREKVFLFMGRWYADNIELVQ